MTGSIKSFFSKKGNLVSTSTSSLSSSPSAILSSHENQKSIENISSTDHNQFQPSQSLNSPSKILSKLEAVNCEEIASLTKTEIDNAEYEKERILNMSVLYGFPASKIRKITPTKASKFFKKMSLASAVTKNINRTDMDCNRTNSEVNVTATTVTASNNNSNNNNNNNNDNDSEYKNENNSIQAHNVKNDNNHNLHLMQNQSNSCHTHENNVQKTTRTYDEYMFQAIDGEIPHQPHTNKHPNVLITRSNLHPNRGISAAEIENRNENGNENENENGNGNGNGNKIVNTKDKLRKVIRTNSCDSENEVEIIIPYQMTVESTHTHIHTNADALADALAHAHADVDVDAHTRHVDKVKRVIERTEQQTMQKKRLVGSSKPFSR